MKTKFPWLLLLIVILLAGITQPARADGIIISPPCPIEDCPPPPCFELPCPPFPPRPIEQLDIRYHHVTVSIEDQIAITRVDQVFYNPNSWKIEGTYVFPLPLDAVVTNFTLWVDGQPVQGQVLDAEAARKYYEDTVRELRDPALLEYIGRGAVKASVFPIEPEGERRIQLEYSQALTAENGLVQYTYPLNTEKFSRVPLEDVQIRVEIEGRQAIRAVYSPTHPVDITRGTQTSALVVYEAKNTRPDSDFSLYYSIGESEAFHLFSYRNPSDPSDPDGFFMLMLAPKPGVEQGDAQIAKDVLLVLDRSGSMDGEKFQQAQAALRYILQQLNEEDRFYLQTFSSGVETYANGLRASSEVNEALAWVDRLQAEGSTDINRALLEAAAVADSERPTYLIFLTDGLPTEGEVDRADILDNFAKAAPVNLRTFAFGVGYDVDTFLLDTLTQDHQGRSTYVRPGEALDESLSAFYEKIRMPVLTDVSLDFGALATYDMYPSPLPDLFSGSQVIVVGRYREGGTQNVTLHGDVNGEPQTFRFAGQTFVEDSQGSTGVVETLPRLWATRKVGALLNRIRLQGPDEETVQQIVKLSIRYGIVTPYTSYLVGEDMPLGADAQEKIAEQAYNQAQAVPMQASGAAAVDRAAEEGKMLAADVAPAVEQPELSGGAESVEPGAGQAAQLRVIGARTFLLQGGRWIDTTFDPQKMRAEQIVFLSEEYFQILAEKPELAAAFALGDQVTVVLNGQAYTVVLEEGESISVEPSATSTSAAEETGEPAPMQQSTVTAPAQRGATLPAADVIPQPAGEAAPGAANPCLGGMLLPGAALILYWVLRRQGKV